MKRSASEDGRVTFPRDDDILCGKRSVVLRMMDGVSRRLPCSPRQRLLESPIMATSKTCVNHVGSRRYREYLETYRERYAAATTKYQKMVITKEIYQNLKDRQCRFLRFNKGRGYWEEVRTENWSSIWFATVFHQELSFLLSFPSQIGPAVARDKIGHA